MPAQGQVLEVPGEPLRIRYRALGLLFLIGLVNYIDRVAMSVLQVPIKLEFGLTDQQIGLLIGFAFFVPYIVLSIPLARMADRGGRKIILLAALLVWSGMTALSGAAGSFALLVVLRLGVAMGEACCLPVSYSLIADYFPKRGHGRAIAYFGVAFPIGSMLGFLGSGWLAEHLGWRNAFYIIGSIGLILAPLVAVFFREPARTAVPAKGPQPQAAKFLPTLIGFWQDRAFRYCILGLGAQSIVAISILTWSTAFYVRVFGMELADAALLVGLVLAGAGAIGTLTSGLVCDWLAKSDQRWLMRVPALAAVAALPLTLLQFLSGSLHVSIGAGVFAAVFANFYLAPTNVVIQRLAKPDTRAVAAAVGITVAAVIGGALGPWGTGVLSDALAASSGSLGQGLRAALGISMLPGVAAAALYAMAARHLPATAPEPTQA